MMALRHCILMLQCVNNKGQINKDFWGFMHMD